MVIVVRRTRDKHRAGSCQHRKNGVGYSSAAVVRVLEYVAFQLFLIGPDYPIGGAMLAVPHNEGFSILANHLSHQRAVIHIDRDAVDVQMLGGIQDAKVCPGKLEALTRVNGTKGGAREIFPDESLKFIVEEIVDTVPGCLI